jgi:hypothetical protein
MATTYRYPGSLPTMPRPRRPLIVELLMPLRMPLAFAVILAAWPLVLPLVWVALLGFCVVMLARRRLGKGTGAKVAAPRARSGAAMVAAARAAAPTPRQPANAITRTAGRLPRR